MLNEKTQKDLQLLFNDVRQYLDFNFKDINYYHFAFLKERLMYTLKSNEELKDFLEGNIDKLKENEIQNISLKNKLRYRRIHRGSYARF